MALKNFYPEKPMLPYRKTTVAMSIVIADIQAAQVLAEIKRMAYIMFRNEGANGQSGINNNYCGIQADSGRWAAGHDAAIVGIVQKNENGTGKPRLFVAFADVKGCLDMLLERVAGRGLYIGGTTHKVWAGHLVEGVDDLCTAYQREWVKGDKKALPTPQELKNFKSMYAQAKALFP